MLDIGVAEESRCSLQMGDFHGVILDLCNMYHTIDCDKCFVLSRICTLIQKKKILTLTSLWRSVRDRPYIAQHARSLFLQVPIVILKISDISGRAPSNMYVCEKVGSRVSYNNTLRLLEERVDIDNIDDNTDLLADVMKLTTTDAEKEMLKFVASAVLNVSKRQASNYLGISKGYNSRVVEVTEAVQRVEELRVKNQELMEAEIAAKLGKGFYEKVFNVADESEESCSSDEDMDAEDEISLFCRREDDATTQVTSTMTSSPPATTSRTMSLASPFSSSTTTTTNGTDQDTESFESYMACGASETLTDIGMSSESDSEEEQRPGSERTEQSERTLKRIISKWEARTRVGIAKMQLLKRKRTKQAREISTRHPDIGSVMEQYAELCDVGADRWRRTGMLTFSGEGTKGNVLPLRGCKKHLETHYNEKISLCNCVQRSIKIG